MKSLVKAGLLIIGMLTLLVACGGGGGGTVAPTTPPTVTVTADKNSAVASGNDPVTLTATFSTAVPTGTDVQFVIPSTETATFIDGTVSYTAKTSGNSASATIISVKAQDIVATATCLGGTGTKTVSFTAPPDFSTLLWTTNSSATVNIPKLIWATSYPLPQFYDPFTDVVTFSVTPGTGTATISRPTDTTYSTSIDQAISAVGFYPYKQSAAVNLKCTTAGNVTITAQYKLYSQATLPVTCSQ